MRNVAVLSPFDPSTEEEYYGLLHLDVVDAVSGTDINLKFPHAIAAEAIVIPIIAFKSIPSTHSLIHLTENIRIRCGGDISTQRFTQEFGARAMFFLPYFFEFCRHRRRDGDREGNGGACHMSQSLASGRLGEEVKTCLGGYNVNI